MTSSKGWGANYDGNGIFNSSYPGLANINVGFAPYCSSDGWSGNIGASNVPFNFNFRGAEIVTAIFKDLASKHGMGSTTGTRIMYGGCSAGARGALFNLDRIATLVNSNALFPRANLAAFGGLLDSAFWVDIPPPNTSIVPLYDQVKDVFVMANSSGTLSQKCLSSFAPDDQWTCMMGQYAVPFLQTPYLLHAYQYDEFQLSTDFGLPFGAVPDKTPAQLAFDEAFRNETRTYALVDTITPARKGTAALLPACYKHCNTEGSTFSTLATQGVTLEMSTAAWFIGLNNGQGVSEQVKGQVAAVPQFLMEDCTGFNCGTDCPQVIV
jgi:hypothetical protein